MEISHVQHKSMRSMGLAIDDVGLWEHVGLYADRLHPLHDNINIKVAQH